MSARYDKIGDFAETEQTNVPNPFTEEISSFSEKVRNDGKENLLMKERGG